ncbi:MAG: AI-2E family transporter [Gemmiger sp.]|nr:AI-2E family transporter [Gemmiger sp.]
MSRIWLDKKPESALDWLLIIFSSIAFYLVAGHLDVFWGGGSKLLGILSPFAGAIVLAYVLDPIVRWFTKVVLKGNTRLRWLAILAAYLVFVLVLVLLASLVIPQVVSSITMLITNLPVYIGNVQSMLLQLQEFSGADLTRAVAALGNYQQVINEISGAASAMIPQIVAYAQGVASNVVSIFTALAGSIYMLAEKEKLLRQLRTLAHAFLPKPVARNTLRICHIANENFTGFFTGKIIDSAIIAVLTFVLMQVLGMSFAPLISVVVGITNIIPVFGPFIGAVPGVLVLLFVDPLQALEFLVLIICIQQVDGNFIGPKILGHSIGISALWVLFSIVLGGDLLGLVGMVLGVPVFATLYGVLREIVQWCLNRRGIDAEGQPLPTPAPGAPVPATPAAPAPQQEAMAMAATEVE